MTKSRATKSTLLLYDDHFSLDDEQLQKERVSQDLELLPIGCKSYLIVDGISKEFTQFALEIAKKFSFCILLSPLIDVIHSNKIGIHRGLSIPEAWDRSSFRIIKLGSQNSIFDTLSLYKRITLILKSYIRSKCRKKVKKARHVNVLVSLGKFPNTVHIHQILSHLQKRYLEFGISKLIVSLVGMPDSSSYIEFESNKKLKVRSFDIQNAFKFTSFNWDFVIIGAGQTLLEYVSVGAFCFVVPSHKFQYALSKEVGGPFVRIIDVNNLEYENLFRIWADNLPAISWQDYLLLLLKFKRNASKRIWKEIVEISGR